MAPDDWDDGRLTLFEVRTESVRAYAFAVGNIGRTATAMSRCNSRPNGQRGGSNWYSNDAVHSDHRWPRPPPVTSSTAATWLEIISKLPIPMQYSIFNIHDHLPPLLSFSLFLSLSLFHSTNSIQNRELFSNILLTADRLPLVLIQCYSHPLSISMVTQFSHVIMGRLWFHFIAINRVLCSIRSSSKCY